MEQIYNNPQNQEQNTNQNALFNLEEETGSVDYMKWLMQFVSYWYLFVICVGGAYTLSYLENRKWQPIFKSSAQVIIEEGKGITYGANSNLMQGFGMQQSYRNVNNQVIMFSSYDLIAKVVDRLPLTIDTYTRGRFKVNNLYKMAPIDLKEISVTPAAYGFEYAIQDIGNNSYRIIFEQGDVEHKFEGQYGKVFSNHLFTIYIAKSEYFTKGCKFLFRFIDKNTLVTNYDSRIAFEFAMEGSSVISVSLVGEVVQRDVDFINALCDAYLEENLDRKNEVAEKTISFIDQQLGEISDSLASSEGGMENFRVSNQILDINNYSGQIMAEAGRYDIASSEFKLKEAYLDYLSAYFTKNLNNEEVIAPSSLGLNDPALMKMVDEFNQLQRKRSEVGVKNPLYARYSEQIIKVKSAMFEIMKNIRMALNIEKKDIERRKQTVQGKITKLPAQEGQMSSIQRKYKIHDNYYTFLLQKRAEAQIQKASNAPDNVILDRARMMAVVNGGETKKTTMTYLFIGFLLPLLFVILKEFFNNKVVDKKDIEKVSPYSYLGAIRHTNSVDPIAVQKSPRSGLAESYRVIRTRVEFVVQRQTPTRVLVTSTESGDGKTAFSMNLAAMYSLTGRKTILIDLDLRKPSVGTRLGITDAKLGISNYLIGQVDSIDELIHTSAKYKFDVLMGGSVPPNPGELIRSEKLRLMFEDLCTNYDHVIVDTSPIGLVADAYAMMHLVDVNLFLVRSEKTNKIFFKNIIQQLKADQTPNVYVVLNDVDERKAGYSNYHEYGRRSYYMKREDYHSYAKDYFGEEEHLESMSKRRINIFRKKDKGKGASYFSK